MQNSGFVFLIEIQKEIPERLIYVAKNCNESIHIVNRVNFQTLLRSINNN